MMVGFVPALSAALIVGRIQNESKKSFSFLMLFGCQSDRSFNGVSAGRKPADLFCEKRRHFECALDVKSCESTVECTKVHRIPYFPNNYCFHSKEKHVSVC